MGAKKELSVFIGYLAFTHVKDLKVRTVIKGGVNGSTVHS
jgi:hypothetical protein